MVYGIILMDIHMMENINRIYLVDMELYITKIKLYMKVK